MDLPLPDLTDKDFWHFVFRYAIKRSTQTRNQSTRLVENFKDHYDTFFADHNTIRRGFHDNFTESMATNNTVYNKWETLNDHMITYLKGKYQLKSKKMAKVIAYRITNKDPLAFTSIHRYLWYAVDS